MEVFLLIFHVTLAIALIGLVLIQHGKGADVGAAFGSGASSTVFGSQGSGSFLTRLTTVLAVAFFATSLVLAYLSANKIADTSVVDRVAAPVEAPAETDSITPDVDLTDVSTAADVPDVETDTEE